MEEILRNLYEINKRKKKLEEEEKKLKSEIQKDLTEEGYKNDYVSISYTKPSESTTIDLTGLAEKEPSLYKELLRDYPKITSKKGSFNYRFK